MSDSLVEGILSPTDLYNIKLDTNNKLSVLDRKNDFSIPEILRVNPIEPTQQESAYNGLYDTDPDKARIAQDMLIEGALKNDAVRYNSGFEITTPYDVGKKYIDKEFGFSPLRENNDDFYYNNVYKQEPWYQKYPTNVARFIGRVIPNTVTKFVEGLGYLGSSVLEAGDEIGSKLFNYDNNAWADIADNTLSRAMLNTSDYINEQLIPIYKSINYDNKGFFSKLGDASFWNDEFADGVSFFASAFIPTGIAAKAGWLAKGAGLFGESSGLAKGASTVAKFATGAETFGEMGLSVFNVANEAAFEAADTYRTNKANLLEDRLKGLNNYSDNEIADIAGGKAASTFGWNSLALTFSNAWEMKNVLKPLLNKSGLNKSGLNKTGIGALEGALIDDVGRASQKTLPKWLNNRIGKDVLFYGKKGIEATLAEGVWEENVQLAIQRANQGKYRQKLDDGKTVEKEAEAGPLGILSLYLEQLKDSSTLFGGEGDLEAQSSIGVGALLGILGGTAGSKLGVREDPETGKKSFWIGERRQTEKDLLKRIAEVNNARDNAFSIKDIYDENGKVDTEKYIAKLQTLGGLGIKQDILNKIGENGEVSKEDLEYLRRSLLNTYVLNLGAIGKIREASNKLIAAANKDNVEFSDNPLEVANYISELADMHDKIQNTNVQNSVPKGYTVNEMEQFNQHRKNIAFNLFSQRQALKPYFDSSTDAINKARNSLNDFISNFTVTFEDKTKVSYGEELQEHLKENRIPDIVEALSKKKFHEQSLKNEELPKFVKDYHKRKLKEADNDIANINALLGESAFEFKDNKVVVGEQNLQDIADEMQSLHDEEYGIKGYQEENEFKADSILNPEAGFADYKDLMKSIEDSKKKEAEAMFEQLKKVQEEAKDKKDKEEAEKKAEEEKLKAEEEAKKKEAAEIKKEEAPKAPKAPKTPTTAKGPSKGDITSHVRNLLDSGISTELFVKELNNFINLQDEDLMDYLANRVLSNNNIINAMLTKNPDYKQAILDFMGNPVVEPKVEKEVKKEPSVETQIGNANEVANEMNKKGKEYFETIFKDADASTVDDLKNSIKNNLC